MVAVAAPAHPEITSGSRYLRAKWEPVLVVLGPTDGKMYERLQGPLVGTKIAAGQTNSSVVIPTPTPVITH